VSAVGIVATAKLMPGKNGIKQRGVRKFFITFCNHNELTHQKEEFFDHERNKIAAPNRGLRKTRLQIIVAEPLARVAVGKDLICMVGLRLNQHI